jgi:hypothetical protein
MTKGYQPNEADMARLREIGAKHEPIIREIGKELARLLAEDAPRGGGKK